eukprot:TRINITY_DN5292_c0_g1_i9.p1 TRINITY_DN5292_c0_g1~~TRINITY_DN5292_c0_g1_i9.p1  ORF type:complete len:700 (-),score=166.28 TRINITY_DN5292_c0_g1_i9:543-2597(-)
MIIFTIFALFGTDLQLWFMPKSADDTMAAITLIALLLFMLDLVLSSLAKPGYFMSMFFWLDMAATISLIPDIPWIIEPLFELFGLDPAILYGSSLGLARAGRAARAGTRVGRIVRIFKVIAIAKRDKKDELSEGIEKQEASPEEQPSEISKRLSELTTRKVILGVMLMVSVLPFLNPEPPDVSKITGLDHIEALMQAPGVTAKQIQSSIAIYDEDNPDIPFEDRQLLYLELFGVPYTLPGQAVRDAEKDKLRKREIASPASASRRSSAKWSVKRTSVTSAYLNIVLTIFIVVLLGLGSALFTRDANNLMLAPIERMVSVVKKLGDNPLAQLDDDSEDDEGSEFETKLVEAALRKIGSLLQIGFGEAGSSIIGKNLKNSGAIDPMIPGQKVYGVFGFCDIRRFNEGVSCLQETVMPFVNTIANIVHFSVKEQGGAPNKNIGDAFLVIYKTSPEDVETMTRAQADLIESENARMKADGALKAFMTVIEKYTTSEAVNSFVDIPIMHEKMPGYKVNMGFGLHYGWAIEGAIGSTLKIDASYLSPHINLAARLESATRTYGVSILVSGEFVDQLSPHNKSLCRQVDVVTVKGSENPMRLYTIDQVNKHPWTELSSNKAHKALKKYSSQVEKGVKAYLEGRWSRAVDIFEKCLRVWNTDVPTRVLLWYMSRLNFRAPDDWAGFRALTSK